MRAHSIKAYLETGMALGNYDGRSGPEDGAGSVGEIDDGKETDMDVCRLPCRRKLLD